MTLRPLLLLSFTLWATIYLLTLSDVHTYDALSYILDVEQKPWRELFHPHHLAYGPLGALVDRSAAMLSWQGGAERPLQVTNALAGALGVALFAALVARQVEAHRFRAALLAALLLGSSYAYWYYAVEVEVYTIAAVLLIGALGLMGAIARNPSPGLAAALGLVQGLALLFHQTNLLLTLPALIALFIGWRSQAHPRLRAGLTMGVAYGLPLGLIVAGAYLGIGIGLSGLRSWDAFYTWVAGYTTTGFWGGPIGLARLPLLGQGLADTLAQPGGAIVGMILLGLLLAGWRQLRTAPRGVVAICLSWLLIYGLFFFWWEPDNVEFWIASLPPFYLLLISAVWPGSAPQSTWRTSWMPLLALLCGLWMLGSNLITISIRGDAQRDLQRLIAQALADATRPGDLLVLSDGLPELYMPFYVDRPNLISLNQAVAVTAGDWPAACALIQTRIEESLAAGYAVIIAAEAIRPLPAPPGEPPTPADRLGLTTEQVAACYERYTAALVPLELSATIPAHARIPAAQALADGSGWDFTRLHWGWRATGVQIVSNGQDGWTLIPTIDPALTSPPLQIVTEHFSAIELRMVTTTTARDAQLFFLDEAGRVDEARSLRWTLEPGPERHTYRLELRGVAGWQGLVTGLRLDPVGVGDGGQILVESIRLIRADGR